MMPNSRLHDNKSPPVGDNAAGLHVSLCVAQIQMLNVSNFHTNTQPDKKDQMMMMMTTMMMMVMMTQKGKG